MRTMRLLQLRQSPLLLMLLLRLMLCLPPSPPPVVDMEPCALILRKAVARMIEEFRGMEEGVADGCAGVGTLDCSRQRGA
jgi:hypothetical protein